MCAERSKQSSQAIIFLACDDHDEKVVVKSTSQKQQRLASTVVDYKVPQATVTQPNL